MVIFLHLNDLLWMHVYYVRILWSWNGAYGITYRVGSRDTRRQCKSARVLSTACIALRRKGCVCALAVCVHYSCVYISGVFVRRRWKELTVTAIERVSDSEWMSEWVVHEWVRVDGWSRETRPKRSLHREWGLHVDNDLLLLRLVCPEKSLEIVCSL